ncbi:MAG: cation transporter [Clostridia bacterium]|nr:cation transporter [Clostridia bacterium]
MKRIEEVLLRKALKPSVTTDIPGHLRLQFYLHKKLPENIRSYLHYLEAAMELLPGVNQAEYNPVTETLLIRYDPEQTGKRQILEWIQRLTDEGIRSVDDHSLYLMNEKQIVDTVKERLLAQLPQG